MAKRSIIFLLFFMFFLLKAQEKPSHFWDYKLEKLNYDLGQNWNLNSTIDNITYTLNNDDSLKTNLIYGRLGASVYFQKNNSFGSVNNFFRYVYQKKYYSYLYSRIVSDVEKFDDYSGIKQDIDRLGFESGDVDLSGIGYEHHGITFQYGRNRQIIGSGNGIYLLNNEKSNSFDQLIIKHKGRKFRTKYFHGFLENLNNHNRYITGKCLEILYKPNLLISLSEVSIYSGINRPVDLAYLNPISSHIETEFNNRANKIGTGSGNAIWQTSFDWYIKEKYRASFNYVIDELVLDKSQLDSGKVNGIAFSTRIAKARIDNNYSSVFYLSYIFVGTHTFSHKNGYNNFVNRNKPIGWEYGSDGDQIKFGIKFYNLKNIMTNLELGSVRIGQQSIYFRNYQPYDDYMESAFPSGNITFVNYINFNIDWMFRKNFRIFFILRNENFASNNPELILNLGFNYYRDISTNSF